MLEERKSYIIVRRDGLVVHTKPITGKEADWLNHAYSYNDVRDRGARIRYLEEYGNVLDVSEQLEQLKQMEPDLYYGILGVYEDPDYFMKKVGRLRRLRRLPPEVRQIVKELANEVRDFLKEPVRPKPLGPLPVRYLELPHPHIRLNLDGTLREVDPGPEWYAHEESCRSSDLCRGVSVFKDSIWLWFQSLLYTWAVAVRRDVDDRELVAALARADRDDAVLLCLRSCGDVFRDVINRHEAELIDRGYDDVVRKAKVILATAQLLNAGRREEEGVPA